MAAPKFEIQHSCCPQKRDINAPMFVYADTIDLAKHALHHYRCRGCQTEIYVAVPKESPIVIDDRQ